MKHLSEEQIWMVVEKNTGIDKIFIHHLKECPECRSRYESMLEIEKGLTGLNYHQPSMRFAKNIYDLLLKKDRLHRSEFFWVKSLQAGFYISAFSIVLVFSWWIVETGWWDSVNSMISDQLLNGILSILLGIAMLWSLIVWDLRVGKRDHGVNRPPAPS